MQSGYVFEPKHTGFSGDVLCIGSCDLRTIKPSGVVIHTWHDRLSEKYSNTSFDLIGAMLPPDIIFKDLIEYTEKNQSVKKVFMVIPARHFAEDTNGQLMHVAAVSDRVIKYLQVKNLIDAKTYDRLMSVVYICRNLTEDDHKKYFIEQLNKIGEFLKSKNIEFYWTNNPTKNANSFHRPIVNDIVKNTSEFCHYAGWVENQDAQPDSSIGEKTQIGLFETFERFL